MSAEAVEPPRPRNFKDASPREVMAALVPEERPDFDRQWRRALADATDSFDLRTGEPEPGSVPLEEIKALLAERRNG